jgi:chromosome segregation ATPase
LESINSELNRTLEFNERAAAATVERLTQHVLELESKIACLENELLAFSSKDTIELEARLSSLADSLEKQQQEGSQAIEIWHLRFTELSDAMNELKVDYEALSIEKQLIETTTLEVNEMMENERALNESLSMQIHAMDKELSSTKAMLVSISEEGERAAEALQREIDKNAETISVREARAITLEKLLGDLRSEMDNVRSAAEESLETAHGKKNSLFSA